MSKLMLLHDLKSNAPVMVNMDNVLFIRDYENGSSLTLRDNQSIFVRETLSVIGQSNANSIGKTYIQ